MRLPDMLLKSTRLIADLSAFANAAPERPGRLAWA